MNPNMASSALESWALLVSLFETHVLARLAEMYVPVLLTLLQNTEHVDLRVQAGLVTTLLVSAHKKALESGEFASESKVVDTSTVVETFEQFLNDSGKLNKNEMRVQRHKFREYLATLEDSYRVQHHKSADADYKKTEWPIVILKLRGQVYRLSGWSRHIQYHMFKTFLGHGLQTHLLHNATLHEVFELDIDLETPQLNKADKAVKKQQFEVNERKLKIDRKKKRQEKVAFEQEITEAV